LAEIVTDKEAVSGAVVSAAKPWQHEQIQKGEQASLSL